MFRYFDVYGNKQDSIWPFKTLNHHSEFENSWIHVINSSSTNYFYWNKKKILQIQTLYRLEPELELESLYRWKLKELYRFSLTTVLKEKGLYRQVVKLSIFRFLVKDINQKLFVGRAFPQSHWTQYNTKSGQLYHKQVHWN